MIFAALEQGRATAKEARQFHALMMLGPNGVHEEPFHRLWKKLGIGMVADGQITPEILVALGRNTTPEVEIVSEWIERTEDGKTNIDILMKFPDKPPKSKRSTRSKRGGTV